MASLALIAPRPTAALYEIAEDLVALLDTEALVSPEQELEFQAELADALQRNADKIDATDHSIAWLESQATLADEEIDRLQKRKALYVRAVARLRTYVVNVIRALGKDEKDKYRKLGGNTVTLRIQKNPDKPDIVDESAIPAEFRIYTVRMPATAFERLLDSLDVDLYAELRDQIQLVDSHTSKTAVKAALEAKREVPGARWAPDSFHLRRS